MHDVIVIGACAGGIAALNEVVAGLPDELSAGAILLMEEREEAEQ